MLLLGAADLLLPTATSFQTACVSAFHKNPTSRSRRTSDDTANGRCIPRTCNLLQVHDNFLLIRQAVTPGAVHLEGQQEDDVPTTSPSSPSISSSPSTQRKRNKNSSDKNTTVAWQQWKGRYLVELAGFVVYCAVAALALIQWEDYTGSNVLPSRQPQRTLAAATRQPLDDPQEQHPHYPTTKWGASTIHGLAFGRAERRILENSDDRYNYNNPLATTLPSYNEIMERHRTVTVPQWRQQKQQQQQATATTTTTTTMDVSSAIHTVVASLQQVWALQTSAEDYQWETTIRPQLRAPPLQDLPAAGAVLRATTNRYNSNDPDGINLVVGFEWGSCAWRHCGAVADAQEAIDELDQLLGVLEPYEAVFCLDIVERSLRDILAVLPWDRASERDLEFYQKLPPYQGRVSVNQNDDENNNGGGEDEILSRIDDAYFRALQELRID